MFSARPHKLIYRIVSSGGYNDEGIFTQGVISWSNEIPCRFEKNTKARMTSLPDGQAYLYAYVVYLDKDVRSFSIGEMVKLFDNAGNQIDEKQVVGYFKGQLNTTLWL